MSLIGPVLIEDVPTPPRPLNESYVKPYAIDVKTSRTPEEGAYSPGWPNRPIIVIISATSMEEDRQVR
jgi:hypothetical protein